MNENENASNERPIAVYATSNDMPMVTVTSAPTAVDPSLVAAFVGAVDKFATQIGGGSKLNSLELGNPQTGVEINIYEPRKDNRTLIQTPYETKPGAQDTVAKVMHATQVAADKFNKGQIGPATKAFEQAMVSGGVAVPTLTKKLGLKSIKTSQLKPVSLITLDVEGNIRNQTNYNEGIVDNPILDENGQLKLDVKLVPSMTGALQAYAGQINAGEGPTRVRFEDYSLDITPKMNEGVLEGYDIDVLAKGKKYATLSPPQQFKLRDELTRHGTDIKAIKDLSIEETVAYFAERNAGSSE